MTVTEAPRSELVAATADTEQASPSGLAALVGSGDPRSVGNLFVGTSLLFFLVAGVCGVLVGFEGMDTAKYDILGTESFAQVNTLYAVSGLFLVVLPLMLGLATAIVPLQVGASTLAFPRASAAAYWGWLVSGGLVLAAYAVNGGPYGGDEEGVALFTLGLIAAIGALCVATVSVVTTVIALRAPGMSLRRVPLFSWSMLVGGTVWLLVLPVVAGVLLLSYVDFTYGRQLVAPDDAATDIYGGIIYERLRWVFWQPTIYVFAVPALGIIADIVPVFGQTRHKRHKVAMGLIGFFAVLGFGAWAQIGVSLPSGEDATPMPMPWLYDGPWVVVSFLAIVPVLGLLGLWTGTLGLGKPKLNGPLLLALVAGALLLLGVAAGAGTAIEALEVFDTTWTTGQAFAVLISVVVAGFAGIVYWAPKLFGTLVAESVPRLTAPLFLLGTAAVAICYGVAGMLDEPRFLALEPGTLDDTSTIETLNLVAAIGMAVVVAAGVLAILGVTNAARAARVRTADDDPWNGHTLEWTTSSPPPIGNFAALPEITSEAPLYDARHAAAAEVTETEGEK